nr:hypothetical protein CFP56_46643 [Quercus suber]
MSNNLCEGYPGSTISEVDAKATASGAYNLDPNVVLLHLGTNDCAAQRQPIDTAPQRYATLLSHLKAKSPNALILMSSLIHNKNPTIEACLTKLNVGLASVAKTAASQGQNVQFVDMVDAVPWNDLSADGTHPTDAGYALMAQKWSDSILSANMVTNGQKLQDKPAQTTTTPSSSTASTMTTRVVPASPTSSAALVMLIQPTSSLAPTTVRVESSAAAPTSSILKSSSAVSTNPASPQIAVTELSSASRVSVAETTGSTSMPSISSALTLSGTATVEHSSVVSMPSSKTSVTSSHIPTSSLAPYPSSHSTGAIINTGLPSSRLPSASAGPGRAQSYTSDSSTSFGASCTAWTAMIVVQLLFLVCMFGFY